MKICLLRQNDNTPTDYLTGGESQFDFTDDIVLNDVAQELNEVGSLKESGIISTSLPKTQKNRFFVQQYASKPNSDIFEIPVRIWVDGYQVNENIIRSNGGNDRFWEIEFVAYNWVYKAKREKLCSINGYSPYIFQESYVDAQSNLEQGQGVSNGIVFPLANYGGFHKLNGVSFEETFLDYRPWFYLYKLMKTAMCYCGVNFVCPYLESDMGKALIVYLSGGEKWDHGYNGALSYFPSNLELPCCDKYAFRAYNNATQALTGSPASFPLTGHKVLLQNDSTGGGYDTGGALNQSAASIFGAAGFWDTTNSKHYYMRGVWNYYAVLYLTASADVTVDIKMEMDASVSYLTTQPLETKTVLLKAGVQQRIEYRCKIYQHTPTIGYALTIAPYNVAPTITVGTGTFLEGIGETVMLASNFQTTNTSPLTINYNNVTSATIVFPQSYIHPDLTIMELIEGFAHVLGAKLDYDPATNTVKMLTDFDTYITGDYVQGFYNAGQVDFDLTGRELCETRNVKIARDTPPCTVSYGFKKSTDEYIQDKSGDEPFERTVNLKPKFPKCEDETEDRNPLFEPTLDKQIDEIKPATGTAPIVPVLLDNLSGALSTSIGARIAVYYGPVNQKLTTTSATNRTFRRFWGGSAGDHAVVFYASQYPTLPVSEVGGVTTFLKGLRPVLSYGPSQESLYVFHRKELLTEILGKEIQADYFIKGLYEWRELNFRRSYIIRDNDNPRRYYLIEKEYDPCSRKATLTLKERENKICLCPYPCDGDITAQEIGKHEKFLPNGTYNYQVNYFRLNGVDIINTPYLYAITVTAGSFFTAPLGGQYLKSDVDALNSFFQLFAPNIKLSYATSMNRMNIEFPSCYSFAVEIIDSPSSSADGIRLTENGITHITLDGGATWYAAGAALLGTSINSKLLPPSGIKFSNQCNAAD